MTSRADIERKRGMDPGDYDILNDLGRGLCWICELPESVPNRSLAVDHDHETGAVRGLLCGRCNNVLGRLRDNAQWLRNAADYLDRARSAYTDGCDTCLDAGHTADWITPPAAIVERDEGGTVFGYICNAGHRWTCWLRTVGIRWPR